MANDAPIAIDFLSDPSGGMAGARQMELELARITKRVETLTKAFQALDASITSGMVTRIAAIANSTNRMQAGAQSSAAAAQALAASLAAVSSASGPLTAVTAELTALVAQLRAAGQATRNLSAGGSGSNAGGATGGAGGGTGAPVIIGRIGSALAGGLGMAALAAAAADATKEAIDLEQALAGVAAVGEIDRATSEFRKLSQAVGEGSRQFTSLEKAGGMRELVAAGLSASDATKTLNTTLQLATAGEMSMSRAAEILTSTMSMFKVEAKDSVKVIDAIVKASNLSLASVDSMGEAMKFIGPVASAMKLPLNEVSAALALLAKAGVQGGMAGRGLGAVFARIVAPSEDAKKALKTFGIEAKDLNPALVGLETMIQRLSNLDQETLVKLFGAENLDVSNTLALNAKEFAGLNAAMKDITGTAARFAATMSDTTAGSLKAFKNTITEIKAEVGKLVESMLDAIGESLGDVPDWVLTGLRAANEGPGKVSSSEAKDFEKRIKSAKTVVEVENAVADIRSRQLQLAEAISDEMDDTFVDDAAIDRMGSLIRLLEKVKTNAGAVYDAGAAARSAADAAAVANASALINRAIINVREAMSPTVGPMQGRSDTKPDMGDVADRTQAFDDALSKAADIQNEIVRRRQEFTNALAIEEAKAAGDNTLAEKLQRELDIMRDTARLAKELDIPTAEAGGLAERLAKARDSSKGGGREINTIADSLQSIGGGGRFFSGGDQNTRIMSEQLAVQQSIRDNIAVLNNRLGTNGSGVIRGGFN